MSEAQADDLEQDLRRLLRHPSFRALRRRKERFRPMDVLGVAHREHSHNDFLAFLLDPHASHGLHDQFTRDFVALIADAKPITPDRTNPLPLSAELAIHSSTLQVQRERHHIDIVIDCLPNGPIIGVESKIWAGEQAEQLERYQRTLEERYPGRIGILAFLTPDGRAPGTAQQEMNVPCVCISWGQVGSLLGDLVESMDNDSAKPFIAAFSQHLTELAMGNPEDRALVGELFATPEMIRVFKAIEKTRPRFSDPEVVQTLTERAKGVIKDVTGGEVEVFEEGPAYDKMVSFRVKQWRDDGFPVRFVFYHCPAWDKKNEFPGYNVLVHEEDIPNKETKQRYLDIARQCNGCNHELIKAVDWDRKYAVLERPPGGRDVGWVIEDESFGDAWMDRASELLRETVRQFHDDLKDTGVGQGQTSG